MSHQAYKAAQARIADLWGEPHAPEIEVRGSKVRLIHPFGQWVEFDLHRSSDELVFTRAIEALREKVRSAA